MTRIGEDVLHLPPAEGDLAGSTEVLIVGQPIEVGPEDVVEPLPSVGDSDGPLRRPERAGVGPGGQGSGLAERSRCGGSVARGERGLRRLARFAESPFWPARISRLLGRGRERGCGDERAGSGGPQSVFGSMRIEGSPWVRGECLDGDSRYDRAGRSATEGRESAGAALAGACQDRGDLMERPAATTHLPSRPGTRSAGRDGVESLNRLTRAGSARTRPADLAMIAPH